MLMPLSFHRLFLNQILSLDCDLHLISFLFHFPDISKRVSSLTYTQRVSTLSIKQVCENRPFAVLNKRAKSKRLRGIPRIRIYVTDSDAI